MSSLLQDVRYGFRMLGKNPGFTVTAVLSITIAIASAAVVFSVVDAVLLHPLPYQEPDRLVTIVQVDRTTQESFNSSSPANYLDWVDRNHVFSELAASTTDQVNLTDGDRPERARSSVVTSSFFSLFGVAPQFGRPLMKSDEQANSARVVVLSDTLWKRRYAADRKLIGNDIRLNGEPYTVVGVMPADFSPDDYAELWIPSRWGVPPNSIRPDVDPRAVRDSTYLDVWGRLKPGIRVTQAQAEMRAISARLEQEHPDSNKNMSVSVTRTRDERVGNLRPVLLLLFAAVGVLLVIGCANVANLLLVRAATRVREISIRAALGATRRRLVQQLLTESVILSIIGGLLGALLAVWAVPLVLKLSPTTIRHFSFDGVDSEVLAFAFSVSVLTSIVFGIVPAISASTAAPAETLRSGERGSTATRKIGRSTLVIVEVALSVLLLIGAGLVCKSFYRLVHVEPGFRTDRILVVNLGLPPSTNQSQRQRFYREVLDQIRGLPGVESTGAISRLPLAGGNSSRTFNLIGNASEYSADVRVASDGYFATLGIPLLKGREFSQSDRDYAPHLAIINETAAHMFFNGQDPIGKLILNIGPRKETLQVVGIVGNVRHLGLSTAPRPEIYQPMTQASWPSYFVVIRSKYLNPLTVLPDVRTAVRKINKDIPLGNVRTMDDLLTASLAQRRFAMLLISVFAALAMLLAVIGLYGFISYSVVQRTRELGIRLALGASRRDVLTLIVTQGVSLVIVGLILGVASAVALTRLISRLLYGVPPTDVLTFVSVCVGFAAVSFFASWLPARRATFVDPVVALRAE
ncbi:MAG: ABC transporter permease [Verrucomicrobia bacterium]|nr:ABC transporter permease [Verrucomicrobiota bacterium]